MSRDPYEEFDSLIEQLDRHDYNKSERHAYKYSEPPRFVLESKKRKQEALTVADSLPKRSFRYDDPSSKAWTFTLKGAEYHDLCPKAWEKQVRYCIWIVYDYTPDISTVADTPLREIHGYLQFNTVRHVSLLKSRYSKNALWSPVSMLNDSLPLSFATRRLYRAERYSYGVSYFEEKRAQPCVHLERARTGPNDVVEDLLEPYNLKLFNILDDGIGDATISDMFDFNFVPPPSRGLSLQEQNDLLDGVNFDDI